MWMARICSRAAQSGSANWSSRSKRPGLVRGRGRGRVRGRGRGRGRVGPYDAPRLVRVRVRVSARSGLRDRARLRLGFVYTTRQGWLGLGLG